MSRSVVNRFVGISKRRVRLSLLTVAFALLVVDVYACQVPVFRYALERWSADQYQIVVLHDQKLSDSQSKAFESLKKSAEKKPGKSTLTDVYSIDIASEAGQKKMTPLLRKIWGARQEKTQPLMLAYYPKANSVDRILPAWQSTLTTKNVDRMLDSPGRQKVAKRLQKGDSAVWVFVPSGRKKDDDAAYKRLEKQIAEDASWLELPSAEELEVEADVLDKVKIPLKIHFSIVTVKRDDPAEKFFIDSLMHSEPDLTEFDEPMVFPVFGQGRVLYGLIGKGISKDTIRTASSFMAGPCSCQVKNQNPGFDLLLNANWKKALGDVLISEPIESVDTEANAPKLLTIPPGRKK